MIQFNLFVMLYLDFFLRTWFLNKLLSFDATDGHIEISNCKTLPCCATLRIIWSEGEHAEETHKRPQPWKHVGPSGVGFNAQSNERASWVL